MEKIELSDLRRAIAVSQHRSLRQAAQTLNIRQSTLSRRLRDIEYRLGACLFERTNGGTRPTAIGLEFLEVALTVNGGRPSALSGRSSSDLWIVRGFFSHGVNSEKIFVSFAQTG